MRGLICWVVIGVVVASVSPAAAFAQTACPDELKIVASDGAEGDQFGWSVSLSGDTAIVGARFDHPEGSSFGLVYIWDTPGGFVRGPGDLNGDSEVNGADLATLLSLWGAGGVADVDGDGINGGADLAIMLAAWGPVCQ